MVTEYGAQAEDRVEALENFCRKSHGGATAADVLGEVREHVKLQFDQNANER